METDWELIQKAERLHNLEEAAWDKGDVLGVLSSQQAQIENEESFFSLTDNDNSIIEYTKPSPFSQAATMARGALKKVALPAIAGIGLLTGAYANLIDDAQHLTDNPIVFKTVQTVPDAGYSIDTPITDGSRIVFEENGKVVTVDTSDGAITRSASQINGLEDARIDNGSTSFKMINSQTYLLLAKDSNGFLRTVESNASGSEPTWYNVSHDSDGEQLLRAGNNGGAVRENIASGNEQTVYSNGSVSNLRIDGDLNLFVANESTSNGTLERLLLVDSNDVANATVIHNGAIKFAEMSNGSIYVGVENQQNSQTVDLYTFDQNGTQVGSSIVGLTPNTFDVDDGKMVKIENNGTVYAVDITTGDQVELTNTSVSKADIDMEGSIATWVQNGTQVAYVTIPDVINSNSTNQSSGPTLEEIMNQLNATSAQLNQTRDQLNASQANETNYLANISNLTAEVTALQGNATNNSAEIDRLNGDVSNLTAEVSSYISNATNSSAEITRLNGEVSNRTAEIAALEANGTNNSAEIDRLNGDVSNLTAEVSSYIASAANDSTEITRLNSEISNRTSEIAALEANGITYLADIDRLNGDVSNLTAEVSEYITQLNTITDQRDENATLASSLEDQLGNATDQRDENATLASSLAEQVSDLESDNSDAIAYGNTITDQRDENATEVEILEAALNDAKADNTDLVVGGIVGAAIGAVIATKRATSKPQVDYGSDEEE